MAEIKDPEATDLTSYLVDILDGDQTEVNGRDYAVIAMHDADDYQTVHLELADIGPDDLGPEETIEYSIKITKKREKRTSA